MEGSTNNKEIILSVSQFTFIILGCMVGIGVLSLPNDTVKSAHQDGWISALIGGIYPLYVILITSYISKNFPNDNILIVSKKHLGRFLGGLLNFIFATYFIFSATMMCSSYSHLMQTYAVGFLTSFKVITIIFILALYMVSRDIKAIGRVSEVFFYLTIILILSPIPALRFPNMSNIYPVFGSGLNSIAKGAFNCAFSYAGVEIILLIYPFLKEKNKIFSSSLISVILVIVMYVWCVFITIYYLGPDIVPKNFASFLLATGSVTITVLNNYRYIFLFLWSLIALKTISILTYGSIYILKDFAQNIEMKKICFFMYPILVYIALKYGNEINRQMFSNKILPCYVLFNLLYITFIAILVFFKRGAKT